MTADDLDFDLAKGRLSRIYHDQELRLAVHASSHPDCQWLSAWFRDVLFPALCNPDPAWWFPMPPADFAAKLKRIISVTRSEIAATPTVWSPPPRQPLLPGDWPEQTPPPPRRRTR